ncbi:hypothetical protein GOARA_027_00250 [Gordonia araii NBRC 100433]|uniref:DUF3558 domain-containing protein n=1 Tax=Gordonia araii NBRC 100433 TaxID=1073574 RepID=G7GZN7_9ACTN|nr:DUF3558 domain-containing protein [Gordonia araii]NNG98875.1 DUF3558 domain-containing protein [Gordonia araii NBRC 100433]GAB09062.1 hypothetical protein GOARA_027_00250 [Gordonia araii NBRC 100433]
MKRVRRGVLIVAALVSTLGMVGCTTPGDPQPQGAGPQPGQINTDRFDKLTLECQILEPMQIGKAVGGAVGSPGFNGAICRWTVFGPSMMTVTFNWFEWGSVTVEQRTAKKMGYETENIKINGRSAFTQRKGGRNVCGVTAKAPSRGIYTWFVESLGPPSGDPCDGAKKLMELVLKTSA